MSLLHLLYNDIIYRPLLNLLVFFYNVIPGHDIGVVIIILTILIRLALAPSFHKSLKSQKAMSDLQPKLNEMREKHKDNKEAQAKAMMELYKQHNINPLSSCLPILAQLPLLIALNGVFGAALGGHTVEGLYSFIHAPLGGISPLFLGFVNLARAGWSGQGFYWPGIVLAVLTGVTQFWQSKLMVAKASPNQDVTARAMQMQMTYIFPLVFIYMALRFSSGLALYWTAMTFFTLAQQYYIMRKTNPELGIRN